MEPIEKQTEQPKRDGDSFISECHLFVDERRSLFDKPKRNQIATDENELLDDLKTGL